MYEAMYDCGALLRYCWPIRVRKPGEGWLVLQGRRNPWPNIPQRATALGCFHLGAVSHQLPPHQRPAPARQQLQPAAASRSHRGGAPPPNRSRLLQSATPTEPFSSCLPCHQAQTCPHPGPPFLGPHQLAGPATLRHPEREGSASPVAPISSRRGAARFPPLGLWTWS